MLELKNVNFSYDNIKALSNINLNILKGESIALLGTNGSGKSTLLKLLCGIISPQKGSYYFDSEEITKEKLANPKFSKLFHQKVGFVFQNSDAQLFCLDVYEEIAFGPRQMGLLETDVDKRVLDCLKLLEIESLKDRVPYHLSGGEKRKVAIACVLSLNPEVIILDEPLNGLDPKSQKWLANFLVTLNESGKTIITSTHNLDFVQTISKRAVLFDQRHNIVADTSPQQLLDNLELLRNVNLIGE